MGWYRVVKTVKGHRYLYDQRSWREGKKVRTQSRYIGPAGTGASVQATDDRRNQIAPQAGLSDIDYLKKAGVPIQDIRLGENGYKSVKFQGGDISYRETQTEIIIDGLQRTVKYEDKFKDRGIPTKAVKALIAKAIKEGKTVRAMNTGGAIPYWSGQMGFNSIEDGNEMIMNASQFQKIKSGKIKVYGFGEYNDYGMMPYTDIGKEFFEPPRVAQQPISDIKQNFSIKPKTFTPQEIAEGQAKRQSYIDNAGITPGDVLTLDDGTELTVEKFITKFSDPQGLGVQFTDGTNLNLSDLPKYLKSSEPQ